MGHPANLRGEPYLVPHAEIVRRAREAWERGATEICLQGGIHPAFDGDYYASVVRDIANPSFAINPEHLAYTVELDDGRTLAGMVQRRGDDLVIGC